MRFERYFERFYTMKKFFGGMDKLKNSLLGDEDGYISESEYYAADGVEYYEGETQYSDENGQYYADENGEYYADENGEYYADENGEYYADENGEYYADENGEYYADENGEYYADENGEYYADENGEYYSEENAQADNGVVYFEEDDYSYEDNYPPKKPSKFFTAFANMAAMDKVIVFTGAFAAVLIIIAAAFIIGGNAKSDGTAFAKLGNQIEGIDTIGEKGLLAVADATKAKFSYDLEEEFLGYEEDDYNSEVTVSLNTVSVLKDLKIKFNNKATGKLIGNVPFSVTVTFSDGTEETWVDDDMDGIIYRKDIAPGSCKVRLNPLEGEKYSRFTLPTNVASVDVKKEIKYEKVQVKDEVKTEAEIDASKEDTAVKEVVVESTLKDTVAWVESTQKVNSYTQIPTANIPNPAKLTLAKAFMRVSSVSSGDPTPTPTPTPTLTPGAMAIHVSNENISVEAGLETQTDIDVTVAAGATISYSTTLSAADVLKENPTISDGKLTIKGKNPGNVTVTITATDTSTSAFVTKDVYVVVTPSTNTEFAVAVPYTDNLVTVGKGVTKNVQVSVTGAPAEKTLTYQIEPVGTAASYATASVNTTGLVSIVGVAKTPANAPAQFKLTVDYATGASKKVEKIIKVNVSEGMTLTTDYITGTAFITDKTEDMMVVSATVTNPTIATPVVTAVSEDESKVKAYVYENTKVYLQGITKCDSCKITIKYKEPGMTDEEALSVNVFVKVDAHPKNDTEHKLLDKDKHQLYVKDGNNYREAVYADYYKFTEFYVKGEAKYTGWQTLEGKVYFFNKDGEKVTGDQVIQGAKYTFASDGSLVLGNATIGIDVSKWNGSIDWKAVKNSGVSFVIIRCGYRGSSQGVLVEDPKYSSNIKGALAAGLKVGVYFFTQAIDEVEAIEEASFVLEQIKDYKISYPVFLDVESSGGRADKISKDVRTAVCKTFCETVKREGYTSGIYANKNWFTEKMNVSELSSYKIWLAQYASTPSYSGRYDMWQYKSTGRVSGISGDVDLNLGYLGY